MLEPVIKEFGSDVVLGMPDDQRIDMRVFEYKSTTILEEVELIGTQSLKAEDIINELKKMPDKIKEYISLVVLSPYRYQNDLFWKNLTGDPDHQSFAVVTPSGKQVTIFGLSLSRDEMVDHISKYLTLPHEAGHIIDYRPGSFSSSLDWYNALRSDSKLRSKGTNFPELYVSPNADRMKSDPIIAKAEDFADSIAFFSNKTKWNPWLKKYYPNRYNFLVNL